MPKRNARTILDQYDHDCTAYATFCKKLESLIGDLLHDSGLRVHSITSRIKDRASLAQKINREGKRYKRLSDVTDIAGLRSITYLADDVDRVADVIAREFAVDSSNSIDKREALDPDRFGYLSLHHVRQD